MPAGCIPVILWIQAWTGGHGCGSEVKNTPGIHVQDPDFDSQNKNVSKIIRVGTASEQLSYLLARRPTSPELPNLLDQLVQFCLEKTLLHECLGLSSIYDVR